MRFGKLIVAAAMALVPVAVQAQETPQPACATTDTSLPPETAGWATKHDLGSAAHAADLANASLSIGHAVNAGLHPTREVSYVTQPDKTGGSVSYGGMLRLIVKVAGTYKVGLGSPAWIDVVKGKTSVISTAHGHGPQCSSIRKVVDFPLQPGYYVIQISANADPALPIMVWRQP